MVAIVSGEGLGISLSSLSLLGQHGVRGNAAGIRNGESAYINIANGNLVLQGRDEHLESYGLSVDFLRTYNSRGQYSDGGDNWNLGVNRKRLQIAGTLGAPGSAISRTDQDGAQAVYGYDPGRATYVNGDGPAGNNTIRYESETETLLWTDGIAGNHERYEATGQGRLVSTIDNAGNTITYTYGPNGLLSSIVDASGETTELRYDGSKLTQVRTLTASGAAVTRVRYAHDAQDRLASVIIDLSPTDNSIEDGKVYQTTYRYDGDSNRIASITQSDGSTQWFTYIQVDGSYKIASVTDGNGKTTRFDYDPINLRTTVTDPLNLVSTYRYDEGGRLIQMTAPPVDGEAQTSTFTYGYGGHVTRIETGAHTVTMQYASNGNLLRKVDSSGNTVSRTYVGPNRLQTETVYAAASSGDAPPSAPLTTRYVYDGSHSLRFVISPQGRVVEYRYNARGDKTADIRYAADIHVDDLGPGEVPTLAEMQAWAEAANSAFTMRSDLAYDFRGQLSSVTTYASVDDAGDGIADGTQSRTNYVYDQAGLLLSTVDSQSHVTQYVYDGLGRVLAVTDAADNVTVTQYDDAGNRTVVRLANGLTTTSAYDKAGRLIGVAHSNASAQGLGATTYAYDANGRLRMAQDPTGVRRHMLYDAAGRKVADIDAAGALTEYFYNAGNAVIRTIRYQNRLSASALASLVDASGTPVDATLASIRPAAVVTGAAVDRSEWNIYDASERLVMTVDAAGNVTQTLYDGASEPISVIRYATRVDISSLGPNPTVSDAIPPASPQDRITRHFHDSDGLLRATLDAEGYLLEYRYDAAGRRTGSTAYATPVGEALRASGALSAMIPAAGDKDIHVHALYNGKGQVSGQIDGEGYLTESVYDTLGNLAGTIRYAARVVLPPSGIAGATVAALRPAAGPEDRVVSYTYTALGQLLSQTNAEGTVTRYGYDSVGNLLSTTVAAGTADLRSITRQYDLQGRLTAELSAQGVSQLNGDQTGEQIDEIWTRYGMHYAYDAAGRRTATTDPNGNRMLFFYDRDGRLTQTVNALGEVQEQRTNSLGQLISTRQFGSRLDAAVMAGMSGGLLNDSAAAAFDALRSAAADTVQTFTYTADGLSATTTDALSNTSILSYNAFGEVTASTTPIAPGRAAVRNIAYDRRGLQVAMASAGAGVYVRESTRYDAFGRAIESVDGNGNLRTTNYDRLGRTVQTIDPANALRSTTYDAFDRVLSTADALNNVTRYAYDTAARSVSVTTPEGVTITTAHNRHGQKASVSDGRGEVTRFSYDRNGNLLETGTSLTTVSSRYDGANRLTQMTDANGNIVTFSYDAANRLLTRLVDPGGLHLATTYTFDAKGRQIGITDPNGVVTGIHYDLKGQVISRTVDPAGLNLTTSYSHDAAGRVLTVTSPGNQITAYDYDALGRRTAMHVDPDGLNLLTAYAYDNNGNMVAVTDPNGNVTRQVYDANDRLRFTIDAAGNISGTIYDAQGRIVETTAYATPLSAADLIGLGVMPSLAAVQAKLPPPGPQDVVQVRRYDRDGRLTWTVDGTGAVAWNGYDANGNVIRRVAYAARLTADAMTALRSSDAAVPAPVEDAARDMAVQTVYDALNRAVYTIDGNGGVLERRYDGNGNVSESIAYAEPIRAPRTASGSDTDARVAAIADAQHDAHIRNLYDAANRLIYTADGVGALTRNVYSKSGMLLQQIVYATPLTVPLTRSAAPAVPVTADDRVSAYFYDSAGRQVLAIYPEGAVSGQVFDANGNVVQRIAYARPVGPATASTLAPLNRLPEAVLTDIGRDRVTRQVFDGANRLVMTIDPLGHVTRHRFDGAGNVLSTRSYSNPIDVHALRSVAKPGDVMPLLRTDPDDREHSSAYDAANRLIYSVDPHGYVKHTRYDGVGRVTDTTRYANALTPATARTGTSAIADALRVDPAADQSTSFTYDGAGNLVSSTDALGGTELSTFNGLGRKLSFTNKNGATWTYDYDAAGRLTEEIAPSVAVAVVTGSGDALVIDGRASRSDNIVTRLAYDALGNLLSRTEAAGRPEQRVTSYQYDAMGRQVRTIHPAVSVYNPAADDLLGNGATGLAQRTETAPSVLTSEVLYNVFGEAVASRDVAGNLSYKAYDRAGRVLHDVDAMGYVTGYTRNAFGDVARLTRYAAPAALNANGMAEVSAGTVSAAVNAGGIDHGADRYLDTSYDQLGRAIQVVEPTVFNYDSSAQAGNQYLLAGKTTRTSYNAFGQVTGTAVSSNANANVDSWTTTTHYYDTRGMQVATVDAMGYLTARIHDAEGNLVSQTEFARAIAPGGWNTDGFSRPQASLADRVTGYAYDRLNRKVSVTVADLQKGSATDGSDAPVAVTTRYGYDALGNQTSTADAAGAVTYTYYDALGRISAVAAPRRAGPGGDELTPLTAFRRDAYGNVVSKIEYARGAAFASASNHATAEADIADRFSYTKYDSHGNAIQSTDAENVSHYASFDAGGRVARKWQAVKGNDGVTRTLFETFGYDGLGRRVRTINPASNAVYQAGAGIVNVPQAQAGVIETRLDFNAFGEVIARRVDDRLVEYSEYDAAGRVWRTNAGDGIDKVMLYDQQGRVTATIRSAGAGFADLDLRNAGTVDQIAQLADIRRTDTVYDALGRAVRQVSAQRTDAVGGVTVRQVYSHGAINSSAQRASNESGNTGWIGSNSITASWTSLASLGGGDILVELIYQTAGSVAVDESLNFAHIPGPVLTRSLIFSGTDAAAANTGVAMSWQDEGVEGGIEKIAALTVYKKDVHGDWRQVIGPSRGMLTNTIEIAAPNNPKTQVQVQIAAAETGNWATVAAIDFGGVLRADLSALEHGTYQYRVLTTEPGSTAAKTSATGTIGITQQPLVPISNILDYDPFGAGMLSWQTPGASVDQVFRYRQTGTSNWADLEVGSRIDGYSGVNTSALGAGAYDYELVWLHGDDGKAYAHATGQLNISAPLPARYVPPVNLPAIDGLALVHGVVGGVGTAVDESGQIVPGGVFMGWNESGQTVTGGTPDYAIIWPMQRFTQTSVFQYRPAGATAWSERSVDSIITGFDEMSQAQGTHFVVVGDLQPGAYEYKLLVTLNGQSSPTIQATGNLSINGVGPGHYDTVNLQVEVPVTVMPPDPANFIIGVTPTWYGAPVFIGVDESNAPILGAHYEWNGNVVVGVPYTETRVTGTTMQPVTVYVPVETQVVIGYDESQNPVYETQITHEARTVLQEVPVYGTFTVYPPDPARYVTVPGKPIYGPPVAFNFNFNEGPTLGEHYAWQGDVVVSVPYTVMQTETRQQQIWVAGTAPPPTMVLTTPPYTPGYTIPATPKGYALVSTTASNPGGLSTGGSATLAPAGVNDQSASYRPLVNRTYDRWGNVLTVTDPRSPNWITTYKYNLNNQLTEQVQPGTAGAPGAGPVTRIRYDQLGREVAVTDANGHVNSKVYDAAGNLTAEIHADGGIVRHAFDAFGNEVQTSDAMGNVTAYTFDKLDRVTATTRGIAEIYTVNANNSLAFVNAQAIGERLKYDEAGRVLWTQNGNNETTRYGYDLRGNITSTTLPAGQVTYHAFDPQGRRTAEVDANGSLATWEHDYFGRLTGHRDIGGATYSYTYDNAGQLIAQTNSRGQSLAYQYDAAGQQTRITDHALGQATTYAYNLAGQRVLEKTVQDGIIYQESHLSYDALGRLRRVSDGRVDLTYDYDNVGNRLHIGSHVINAGNAVRDKHLYYAYDQMNRQIVVDAVDAAGTIAQGQGHRLGYDLNGNRTSDTSIGNRITAGGGDSHVAGYTVDGSGQLLVDESGKPILNVSVDALGRVYYGGDIDGNLNYLSPVTATTPATYSASIGSTTEQYQYDALGRISRIYRDGTLVDTRRYDGASRMVQSGPGGTLSPEYTALLGGASANGVQTTTNRFDANGRLQYQRVFNARGEDKYATSFDSYDAVGNLLSYSLTNYEGDHYTNTYASTLTLYEGYKEAAVTATSTRMQPGSVANTYDVNGNLIRVADSTQSANSRMLVNDAAGHVLYRNQAGNQQYFVFANGQQIGSTGMGLDTQAGGNGGPGFVEVQDFNIGYRPIDSQYPSAGVGSYRVMAGDTLQSIAQGAYGDSNLWYTLAEVNGLRGSSDLRVGQTITIPNKVAGVHNDGNTFTPYDPARSIGDTTPNMAAPGKDGGCGALGTIIMVVVAAVVMIYAPTVAPELFNVIGQAGGALAQGAVAGAAGAVVSQAVGIAIGAQDGFSWKQVALAAISNGVTQGVSAADFLPDFGGTSANVAARAAVNNALTQGIAVATGLQRSFSWTGVAAAAVGAGVGDQVSSGLKGSAFEEALGGSSSMAMRTLRGFAAGAATAVSGGGRVNMAQIAADAFGNALGNSLADSIRTVSQQDNELNRAQDLVHFGQELTAGDPHNIAGVRWFLENSVAGPGVGIAQLGRDRLSLSDGEASGIDDKVNVATEDEIAARIAKQDAHKLQQLKDELADLQKRRAELERERAYPANSDSPEVSSGLELNSGLLSRLPLGAGFLRGLSGYQRSVFDAPASVSENIGLALNGAFTEGINLIKEPFAEIVDLTRVGFQVARMGSGFHAQSVEPYSMAGKAGASGMAYGDFAGGMLDGIASAPGHLLVNGLNGNWREFGSNLVEMAGLAGGIRVARGLAPPGTSGETVWLDSSSIRHSQKSVSYAKNGGYTLDDIARGFAENPLDPRLAIDAVRMRDGLLTSVDNSRPAVLKAMGGGKIQVRIRAFDELLTGAEIDRFTVIRGGQTRVPDTWGDAVDVRIWKQGDQFMSLYPNGVMTVPKVTGAPANSIWDQYNQYSWKR